MRDFRCGQTVAIVCIVALQACTAAPTDTAVARERPSGPVPVGGSQVFTQVAAGFVHTCALDTSGAAFCWGNNDYSQLGSDQVDTDCGGRPCSKSPIAVSGAQRYTALAAGWVHNCGIATDRRTYCWGGGATDKRGYLGDGTLTRSATPLQVRADSVFASVAIGDGHTCALTASGMAFCWGQNSMGQLGDGTNADRAIPVPVATAVRFRSLSAGAYHTCAIAMDGEGYCWGENRWGQLGGGDVAYNAVAANRTVPTRLSTDLRFSTVAAGWQHTCAITTMGETQCWGRNEDARQLGDNSTITHRGTPAPIAGSLRFAALSAGALSTCGRTAADEVYCWGSNYYGALGNGQIVGTGVGHPVRAQGGPFAQVAIGQSHACGLASDRRLWCWGDQSGGQF